VRVEFTGIGFSDPGAAGARLDALVDAGRAGLAANLAEALAACAAPDAALVRLERFLERTLSRETVLALMADVPRYTQLLLTILDQSHYLTDIVCRNPEYMSWLWQEAELEQAQPREALAAALHHQLGAVAAFEAQCRIIRRFHRREMLRIAARDLFVHASVASVTADLSNLADATLEGALEAAAADLYVRYGRPMRCSDARRESTFGIMALGKLGGRELNFSSDVDLIFLYAAEGDTSGGHSGVMGNAEFYQKLGERVIRALAEHTEEGHVFRVDMRLRPYGNAGPLTVSLESAVGYYESAGDAWERQALIKCRPSAGDLALCREFIERTRPFVYPRYFDDETLEAICDMKRLSEAEVAGRGRTGIEVKLGRGGIRDIEFTVQMLQMLHGGRIPELRAVNTLEAIVALGERGLLRPFEASALASNYAFLREIEHRLQIEGGQQRHVLPETSVKRDEFARRLGYPDGESFLSAYQDRTRETRAILERFLAVKGAGTLWVADLLNPLSDGEEGVARLGAMGFAAPEKARGELLLLANGPPERPHSAHVRQHFASVAPALLEALARAGDPDASLVRLGQILATVAAPGVIYDVLRWSPEFCGHLVTLVSNSRYLTEILIRDPALFETFSSERVLAASRSREDLKGELAYLSQAYDSEAALYRLRNGETLRIGMRELMLNTTVLDVGRELSVLADVCVEQIVQRARALAAARHGLSEARFAVLGLGKLGGQELNYGSDLDLVFVYEGGAGVDSGAYFAEVGTQAIRLLKEPTQYGFLYDVDARLRPDGSKGVLAVSSNRFSQYFTEEAQAWERLALMKIRAIAGDLDFAEKIAEQGRAIAFARPMKPDEAVHTEALQRKLAQNASPLDLKKGEGGLAEIEFAVRMRQLQYAADVPELVRGDVLGAIDVLVLNTLLDAEAFGALTLTYLLFRRIENRIRMMDGRPNSVVPESAIERADLAKRIGIEGDLAELVVEHKVRAHAVCRKILSNANESK